MVTKLMLDDCTAAKFTPVYEKYLKDLSECRMMNRRERPRNNNAEATPATKPVLTDAEIEKQIKDQFAQSRKILDIREKYYNEFRKILSPKQIAKIYQTEKSNANKFRKEFDRRKGQKHGQGKRPAQARPASNNKKHFSINYLINTNGPRQAYIFDIPEYFILCCFVVVRYDC